MSSTTPIRVKNDTLDSLKRFKVIYRATSYDEVICQLVTAANSKQPIEGINNEDLAQELARGFKKALQRVEALHTRIGYFEKDYFLKIGEIYDAIEKRDSIKVAEKTKSTEPEHISEKPKDIAEIKLRKQLEELEESHLEMEQINQGLNKKLNAIRNKIVKKTGVFASGYELSLTDEEYNLLFG